MMPSITFDINELTEDQKAQIVEEFNNSASKITGIPKESFYVFINEFPAENVGVGGKLLSKK